MKKTIAILTALAATAALAIPALAATKTARLHDDYFITKKKSTPTVTIKRNQTVRFLWSTQNAHNVVISGPRSYRYPKSGVKTKGDKTIKFTRTGTYKVICEVHQPNMRMRVRVTS